MPRANLLAFCISIIFFCVPGEATEGGDGGGSEEHSNSVRDSSPLGVSQFSVGVSWSPVCRQIATSASSSC